MRSLDRGRFIYSLAGALIGGEWTVVEIRNALRRAKTIHRFHAPKLLERVCGRFTGKPEFAELVVFLRADAGLMRALSRDTVSVYRAAASRAKMDERPARLRDVLMPKIATEAALAEWLGIDAQRLRWRADVSGRNRKHPPGPLRNYRYRWIPRPGRSPRLLEIPKAALKKMQRKILAEILDPVPAHPAAHGFCKGRSIVTNAAMHCSQATVLRFDLVDFFPSVTSSRVFGIFRTLGFPQRVSRLLMGICTTALPADVWESRPAARIGAGFFARQWLVTRHLPQGAPTSPALANLAAGRLDRRLAGLARSAGIAYTRYADDLTFSGGRDLARTRKWVETIVAVIAGEEGFEVNHRKTRIMRAGVRQQVTGIVVNVRPNICRTDYDQLKAILTNCLGHGPASQNREGVAGFRRHLAGKVAYVASIHPERGVKLQRIFDRISWKMGA